MKNEESASNVTSSLLLERPLDIQGEAISSYEVCVVVDLIVIKYTLMKDWFKVEIFCLFKWRNRVSENNTW